MVERISDPQKPSCFTTKLQEDPPCVKSPLLRAVLEKITDGILWIDFEGIIQAVSRSLEKILDCNVLIGQRFWDVFSDDFFGFSMRESLRYGIAHELIYKNNLEISSFFLYQERGLLVTIIDISERERSRAEASQGERMKQLGEMTSRLAHEIRNPLGGIRGFAMLLHQDLAQQPHLQEFAGQVIEGTRSLERLVCSMLEYAKPKQLSFQTRDITAFLRKIARFVKVDPVFPATIHLALHIPDKPLLVPFDADALQGAILNLLANGLQAMGEKGTLTLSVLQNGLSCQITISDTGIGMDEETMASLFLPFFTTKKGGTGLGLVETKKIITSHGGTIEVHSKPQKGSSFILTLPMRRQ